MRTRIIGTGSYLPERVVTNDDLAKLMTTSDEWIQQRTGVRERRYAAADETPAGMGCIAAQRALDAAGLKVEDIELIIVATQTPDYQFPGTGCLIQTRMGFKRVGAIDVRAQCSGFLYGLSIANAYIRAGLHRNVLLICTEIHSRALDFSDKGRQVTVLFGDGAGAVVLGATEDVERSILSVHIHADGRFAPDLILEAPSFISDPWATAEQIEQGKTFVHMNGRTVFKEAVSCMREVIAATLEANHISVESIDHVVPHQANRRINEAVAAHFSIPDCKVNHSIERFGNCGAASVPIALDDWVKSGRIKANDTVLLASFAAGFTWGGAALRW